MTTYDEYLSMHDTLTFEEAVTGIRCLVRSNWTSILVGLPVTTL